MAARLLYFYQFFSVNSNYIETIRSSKWFVELIQKENNSYVRIPVTACADIWT